MRGSQGSPEPRRHQGGIIPAHAGLTTYLGMFGLDSGDHPRACGAHVVIQEEQIQGKGSSPRMRGSHVRLLAFVDSIRIIPAHAGLTRASVLTERLMRDHPRACGAHFYLLMTNTGRKGSSPRMRGSLGLALLAIAAVGIIPAHAGLTRW